jgi:hypothetical protein
LNSPREHSQTNWLQKKSISSWEAWIMTFQLQTDKSSFQFHIIFLGMNPIKDDATCAADGRGI